MDDEDGHRRERQAEVLGRVVAVVAGVARVARGLLVAPVCVPTVVVVVAAGDIVVVTVVAVVVVVVVVVEGAVDERQEQEAVGHRGEPGRHEGRPAPDRPEGGTRLHGLHGSRGAARRTSCAWD